MHLVRLIKDYKQQQQQKVYYAFTKQKYTTKKQRRTEQQYHLARVYKQNPPHTHTLQKINIEEELEKKL